MLFFATFAFTGCKGGGKETVLRVCSWEEYIDLGDWDESERIDIDNPYSTDGQGIIGVNSMVDDFEDWFFETHGYRVKVEYSTFGTNEDLYNRLSIGDEYDLVCPSDYMLMKLIADGNYVEYSDTFWDTEREENYYAKYVSRFIDGDGGSIFNSHDWHKKAACYMWGTLGLVYNPEKLVDSSDVSSWKMLLNRDYNRQITIKDNVRDAYFATLGIINADSLTGGSLTAAQTNALLNDTSDSTVSRAQSVLKDIKDNVYSFETDSGKADMVTGKVIANEQWSGDAVYIMDEADGDATHPTELWYSIPDECTNIWFDGWLMLRSGIGASSERREAAEAFVNFLSRPDNAVRNMYYIGYTSAIASETLYDFVDWNYGATFDPADEEYFDDELTDVYMYDVSHFFGDGYDPLYIDISTLQCDLENAVPQRVRLGEEYGNEREYSVYSGLTVNRGRQLFAQYPPKNVVDRGIIMLDFGDGLRSINSMWVNVRCQDLKDISPAVAIAVAIVIAVLAGGICLYKFRYKLFIKHKPKKGYKLVVGK